MSRKAEITIRARNLVTQKKLMRKLSWRDSWVDENGELNEVVYEDIGGDIKFVYDPRVKRSIPYVVDVLVPSRINTFDRVKRIVGSMNFPHSVVDDVPGREITISIEEKETEGQFNDLISDLEVLLRSAKFCDYEIDLL